MSIKIIGHACSSTQVNGLVGRIILLPFLLDWQQIILHISRRTFKLSCEFFNHFRWRTRYVKVKKKIIPDNLRQPRFGGNQTLFIYRSQRHDGTALYYICNYCWLILWSVSCGFKTSLSQATPLKVMHANKSHFFLGFKAGTSYMKTNT